MTDHVLDRSRASRAAGASRFSRRAAAGAAPASAALDRIIRRRVRLLRALRLILPLHLLAVLAQGISAGAFFSGRGEAAMIHALGGPLVGLLGLTQVTAAVWLWRRGAGPAWFASASVGLLAGEALQMMSGHNHAFWFHVPMGVLLFGGLMRQHAWLAAQPLVPASVDTDADAGMGVGAAPETDRARGGAGA